MPVFTPLIPLGWTPLLPAQSGLNGTVEGMISEDDDSTSFGYSHDILRPFRGIPGAFTQILSGIWTVQIWESAVDESINEIPTILFEQSVEMKIQIFAAVDPFFPNAPGVYYYSFVDSGTGVGKFKTRIVDGQFVPLVVEPELVPASPVVPPAPDDPGVPFLWDERTTTIQVRMPDDLPARAGSFTLMICDSRYGTYIPIASGLGAGESLTVSASQAGPGATRVEDVWFKLRAVASSSLGGVGFTDGPSVRDTWSEWVQDLSGTWKQIAGYEGWRHIDTLTSSSPTQGPYTETGSGYSDNDVKFSYGENIIGLWASPLYKCAFPAGAVFKIRSDGWTPSSTIADRYTFSISYKPGDSSFEALHDSLTGQTWAFYKDGHDLKCTRTRRPDVALFYGVDDTVISSDSPSRWQPLRSGSTILVPHTIGNLSKLQLATARDEGTGNGGGSLDGAGWTIMTLVTGVKQLGAVASEDGATLYVFAQAMTPIAIGAVHPATLDTAGVETSPAVPSADIADNAFVRILVKRVAGAAQWSVSALDTVTGDLPDIKSKVDLLLNGSTIRLMPAKKLGVEVAISTDEMKSFTIVGVVPGT